MGCNGAGAEPPGALGPVGFENVYEALRQVWAVARAHGANIFGVEIGIVTNVKDPDKQGRVKVCFPRLPGKPESDWARVGQPAAGPGRGFYWIPQVNDEVLVMFERGQSNAPYVIGSVWNGKDKPMKDAYTDENTTIMVQTKSGHQLVIDDKKDQEKITLGDKSGKRTITWDVKNKKFLIEAKEGDLEIHAEKKIVLQCEDLEIKSSKSTKYDVGTTFDLKIAQKGAMKAGPQMNIKGSKVQLNPPDLTIEALVTAAEQAVQAQAAEDAADQQQAAQDNADGGAAGGADAAGGGDTVPSSDAGEQQAAAPAPDTTDGPAPDTTSAPSADTTDAPPADTTQAPADTTTGAPADTTTSEPAATTTAPSGTTTAPSWTTTAPSGTTTAPSGTTTAPSGTTTAPSGTTTAPSGTTTAPSGTTTTPGTTTTAPSGTTTAPSGTTTAPSGTTTTPGTTTTGPSGTTTAPSGTTTAPSGTTTTPGTTTTGPSGTTTAPSGTTTTPGTTTTAPSATTTAPGSTTTAPGSTTTRPGSTTTAPGSTTTAPHTTTTHPHTTTTGATKITFTWDPAEGFCGDTVHLKADTVNLADGTSVTIKLTPSAGSSPKLADITATVNGNKIDQTFQIANVDFGTGSAAVTDLQLDATSTSAATVTSTNKLKVKARSDGASQHFSENRTWSGFTAHPRFDQSVVKFRNLIAVKADIQKCWGVTYIKMDRAGITGNAGNCIAGCRWGRNTSPTGGMQPNQYYDGTAWKDLPAGFTPNAAEYFSTAFYKSGSSYASTMGGTYPDAFADYDFDASEYTTIRSNWVTRVHDVWTEQWAMRRHGCTSDASVNCCKYSVQVDVTFTTVTTHSADTILVGPGDYRSNASTFFMGDTRTGTVPHEIGHLMDNPDEYTGGAVDTSINTDGATSGIDPNCIMGQNMTTVKKRHYHAFPTMLQKIINTAYSNNDPFDVVDK